MYISETDDVSIRNISIEKIRKQLFQLFINNYIEAFNHSDYAIVIIHWFNKISQKAFKLNAI